MATKTIILTPAGLTVPDVSSGAYPTFPLPDSSVSRCIIPLVGGIPADFSSISSVYLIIRSASAGNLYLRFGTTRFDLSTEGAVESVAGTYAAYAGGAGTGISEFISLPSTAWSTLTDINAGDALNFVIDRDAASATDTYNADLDIIGIKFVYTSGYVAGTHYCNQTDLEYKLSTATLAQLTNDTANAATPDANVLELILSNVDATIDAKAGQVYTVPFTTVPALIKRIAIDLACYECFQRRPVNMEMPKMWQTARDTAMQQLEDISNLLLRLPDTATVASAESNIVTPTTDPVIDFYDDDNEVSHF